LDNRRDHLLVAIVDVELYGGLAQLTRTVGADLDSTLPGYIAEC
jgi:hypothetical protein